MQSGTTIVSIAAAYLKKKTTFLIAIHSQNNTTMIVK